MIIGITGYARVGKDTVADYMVDNGFTKLSFADPMRQALLTLDPLITMGEGNVSNLSQALSHLTWDELKAISPDIRPLLQRLGTDVGREMFGQNFWVDLAMKRADQYKNVVFADVRFPNEADAIQEAGGYIIRVMRDGFGPANEHVSESSMEGYPVDYVVGNHASLSELSAKVNVLLAAIEAWV